MPISDFWSFMMKLRNFEDFFVKISLRIVANLSNTTLKKYSFKRNIRIE